MARPRENSRTTPEPPGSCEFSWPFPLKQGREAESSYEPGGSGVVRELSREPAMFQIGLYGEVLKLGSKSKVLKYFEGIAFVTVS